MLGIFVLHDKYDEVTATVRTLETVVADVGQWGTVYAIDNGDGRLPKHMQGVQTVTLRPGLFHVDAYLKAMVGRPCDLYLLLKAGVLLERGVIAKLVSALSEETVGIVAPSMMQPDDTIIIEVGISEQRYVRDWCWGWRHELIKVIGWMEWAGQVNRECPGSDIDYCYRARQAGYQVVQVNEALATLPTAADRHWGSKARGWLVQKYGLLKINEVW